MFTAYERLENHLKNNGINTDEPGFRQNLADEVNDDPLYYNDKYIAFFNETSEIINISARDYDFRQNAVDVLEAVWDYEIKGYVGAYEINMHKRWVIDNFFKTKETKTSDDCEQALKLIDLAADDIIASLSNIYGIIKN